MNTTNTNANLNQDAESGLTLQELLGLLWEGKVTLILSLGIAAVLALAYLWLATPIYKVDALVQVEEKKGGAASAMFGELGTMFDMSSPAETEIEIIKSRMVLGQVVQQQKLDIVAQPKVFPLIGQALLRRNPNPPRLEIESFHVAVPLMGKGFELIAGLNGQYSVFFEDVQVLQGHVGERAVAVIAGDSLRLFVSTLQAEPGQKFVIQKKSLLASIQTMSANLSATEKGKKTGIIALSLQSPNPQQAVDVLNAVAQSYVQQNIDRKSAEAEKTLHFLRNQLPDLKMKADSAENRLNAYRLQVGSIDLNAESKMVLDQGVSLESKKLTLVQQKAELLRLYKEDHPAVKTLETQISQLQREMGGVTAQIKKLPKTQQEILSLQQDAKVAAELYNTMLNNAQQLEVAKAGQVGNVRIIDPALLTTKPIKPKKATTFVLVCMLGLFAGSGLLLLRRFWTKGVEDPKVLESKFGLPVYATIPHSGAQRKVLEAMRKHIPGLKLLSTQAPDDLTVESFRSLRTTLHFSMHDAPNNILLLVGPSPAIGKSFVCANLATILAQTGKRICLIDADMRRGHLHESFDQVRSPGLSDYLSHNASLDAILKETQIPGLTLITTGQIPPNPSELLLGAKTSDLLNALSAQFDLVLIDSAPLLAVADALVLAKIAGSTLLLLKHGEHRESEIEAALKRMEHAGVKVKGCVLNDVRVLANGGKYGYAYAYGYGKGGGSLESK